jgi:hypothetical protein
MPITLSKEKEAVHDASAVLPARVSLHPQKKAGPDGTPARFDPKKLFG